MKKAWNTFAAWCRYRLWLLLFTLITIGIVHLVYGLYGLNDDIALYTSLLILAVQLVVCGVDFARFTLRLDALQKLAGRFPTGELPEPRGALEQEYTKIILALEQERAELANNIEDGIRDSQEYYTLWVHQIKTPLAALRLLAQTGELPNRSAWEQELFRTEQYADMALQYQRLASLSSDLQFEEIPLRRIVHAAMKNSAPLCIGRGLPVELGELDGSVVSDEKWLTFVLEQVLGNALKYTRKGTIKIYTQNGDTLVVEDTGIGIAASDLPRVFERGYTGRTGREDRRSTGLGLYLCHQIMSRLGFSMRVESQPGKGTQVYLCFAQQRLEQE